MLRKAGRLRLDAAQELPVGGTECLDPLVLKLPGQGGEVESGRRSFLQHARCGVGGERRLAGAVVGEGPKCADRHGVDDAGPMSPSTYMTSEYAGSFVPVLAQRGRCGRAPSSLKRCQR